MNDLSVICGPVRPEFLREEVLADIFKASLRRNPEQTALIFGKVSLSYRDLDLWSDAVALSLTERGIGRGDRVGVWWPRGLELHVAILGITKVGAAYVPLDFEMPAERVALVMKEVEAIGCFCQQQLTSCCFQLEVCEKPSARPAGTMAAGAQPDDYAYILYTSGSTGKPKGIPISQRQICHLLRAEQSVFNIIPSDRVYQGFSVSFDMWCEETWLSYLVGASLWLADSVTAKAIDELGKVLDENKITVLHAVPSLLAVMDDHIPSLRLINAGGEACTPQVLFRWAKPSIQFFNSYGPTETTVTATIASLGPTDKITIGLPLPNYGIAVVDEAFNLVAIGQRGEMVISGPGVSDGYLNLPLLTEEKFIKKPGKLDMLPGDRLYRTGDAVVLNADDSIDFLGRLDDQIKLRGYRIELGEIENCLNNMQGVSSAAVAVRKDSNGQDQLAGYVVVNERSNFNVGTARSALAKVLPVYMVPTITILQQMPRTVSGKVDKKALSVVDSFSDSPNPESDDSIDETLSVSERVLMLLKKTFPDKEINPDMDFFTDLGGHSLLAAIFVSKLRNDYKIPSASLRDLYTYRPLHVLIRIWEQTTVADEETASVFNKIPNWRFLLCWLAQSISLLAIYGMFAIQIFVPYLGYYYVRESTGNLMYGIITSIAMYCLILPFFTIIGIVAKWLIIGKMKAGDYPLWGLYYFRWWFVKTIQSLVPTQFMNGTPLYPLYLRMMGVKIAGDAQLSSISIGAEDLLSIGHNVSISSQVILNNAVVEDGLLKLRNITLGDHAYIGSSSVIGPDAVVHRWGELQDLSYLPPGMHIGAGQIWKGSPAKAVASRSVHDLPVPLTIPIGKRLLYSIFFTTLLVIFPVIVLLPLFPVILVLHEMDNAASDYDFSYMIVVPLLAAFYIILYAFETIILSRFLLKGIKPGIYPVYSAVYVRKWISDQLMSLSLIVLHPLFATVYIIPFFRMLGAKVGKNTEISTASNVTHTMLEIGHDAFIADAVVLGEADVRGQQLILDKTVIESGSFVGNSALIPQGYQLPGNMLIGVLSTPPEKEQLASSDAKTWFGSPSMALPRRQESSFFPDELTKTPSWKRRLARGITEFIRIILPETTIICFSILFIAYGHDLLVSGGFWEILLLFPLYYLGLMGLPAFFVTILLKWLIKGKYKAEQKPMWSWAVWSSEAITSTYEALSVPFLLEYLKGTPWLPLALRLLGVKTGKRVWMNSTDVTEYDMINIGDDVALNEDCGPQTHLFEDRVMKIGHIKIGDRSSIGVRSIILYDSEIGSDVKLDALSLVMKGEMLASGTAWVGSPVKPITR